MGNAHAPTQVNRALHCTLQYTAFYSLQFAEHTYVLRMPFLALSRPRPIKSSLLSDAQLMSAAAPLFFHSFQRLNITTVALQLEQQTNNLTIEIPEQYNSPLQIYEDQYATILDMMKHTHVPSWPGWLNAISINHRKKQHLT